MSLNTHHRGQPSQGMPTAVGKYGTVLTRAAVIATLLVLAACGNDKPIKAGQALVKVNKEEITVHQLNTELRFVGSQAANLDKEKLQKQLVDSLVDRQLLVEEALRTKLDRDGEIMQLLERSKSQILAQAFLQRKVAALPKPSQTEIADYFRAHPELFTQRKLYDLKQVMMAANDFTPEVKAAVDSAKSMEDVAAWLDAHKIRYGKERSNRTTADLPANLLGQLNEISKGTPFVVKDSSTALIASLTFLKDVPVAEQAAYADIEKFLMNKKAQEEAASELARLRKAATIVVYNDQASPAPAIAKAPEPTPATPAKPEAPATGAHIERGVAGLK
jgi:peptidyl-prolyl cis-trans isomerase C